MPFPPPPEQAPHVPAPQPGYGPLSAPPAPYTPPPYGPPPYAPPPYAPPPYAPPLYSAVLTQPGPPLPTPGAVKALRWILAIQLLLAVAAVITGIVVIDNHYGGDDGGMTAFGQLVSIATGVVAIVLLGTALMVASAPRAGPFSLLWLPQLWTGPVGLLMVPATSLNVALAGWLQGMLLLCVIPALVLALSHDVREWAELKPPGPVPGPWPR